MSIFSDRLEQQRKEARWTKTYVSKMLNIPLTTYANYEYGRREPDIETINAIASLFHTTSDYLMGRTNNPNIPGAQSPTSQDLDKMLDDSRSYDGKPMTKHDRVLIKQYLEALYGDR